MKNLIFSTILLLVNTVGAMAVSQLPNIIYLMADDQSTYSVGCYGNKDVKTPQMDQLGQDGVIFDSHYNTTSICMASRGSVFTGMYEYKTGTNFSHGDMHPETWDKSYPVLLRKAGYVTAFAGKFGLSVKGKGICEKEFDYYGGGNGQTNYATKDNKNMVKYAEEYPHSTLSYGAFGRDFIRDVAQKGIPFCLSISFKAPHKPATPDPRFDDVYKGKTFTKPKNYGREHSLHLSEQSKQGRQYRRFTDWHYDTDYDSVMALYYQQIYGIDVALGMIREELKKQGVDKNTVIIYTSDNGYICGSHGYGSKVLPMEESSRVPLIIYDPRSNSAGKKLRSEALTANIDFAPTILELAGIRPPDNMDGTSLTPLLRDPSQDVREQIAFINTYGAIATQSLSCITKDWKYTYWWLGDDQKGMKPTEELFNLKEDPLELQNYAAHTDVKTKKQLVLMREKYDQELARWKNEAVTYNDYQRYITLFDRNIPYQEKEAFKKKK